MKITKDNADVTIELFCENEDTSFVGNCMASGDPEVDKEAEDWIRNELRRGNEWAWFVAHVRVSYKGFVSNDYLGGCSYKNEDDFRNDPYFADMVQVCIDDLNNQLTRQEHLENCDHCQMVAGFADPMPDPIK